MDDPTASGQPSDVEDAARQRALARLKAKRDFMSLLGTAAIVIAITIVIWAVTDSDSFWPVWVMLGFAIALFFSALQAYGPRRSPITDAEIQREMDKGT
jgi:uncharacterized membrane protein